MQEIVYGDILFIINFSMDFLALFITACILHRKVNTLALILASGIGAVYAVMSLFIEGNTLLTFMINIGVSALMCYIVFAADKVIGYFKSVLIFYTVSFISGGGITALYNLLNSHRGTQKVYMNGNIASIASDIPLHYFIILAVVSLILSLICGRVFNRKSKQKNASVTAMSNHTSITFDSLVDSGNLLKEPISGIPVIVTNYNTLKPILPEALYPVFENHDTNILYQLDFSLIRRVKVIPMTAVGHSGILMGFIPDRLIVDGIDVEACIAADMSERDNDFGGYEAVMPAILID